MKSKLLIESTTYKALANDARKKNLPTEEQCEIQKREALNLK